MSWSDRGRPSDTSLVPVAHRFPVNVSEPPLSTQVPGPSRPFILRGLVSRRVEPPEARHRTAAGQTLVPRRCNQDGKLIDDSYTVPDD